MSPKVDRVRRKVVYRCDLCPLEFDTREDEVKHVIHDHYPAKYTFFCDICNKK